MERYVIKPYDILKRGKVTGEDQTPSGSAFDLIILSPEEWHKVPAVLVPDKAGVDLKQLEQIATERPQAQNPQTEMMGIAPVIVHLSPHVHYVCYRDLDEQGHEVSIKFFLMPKRFILVRDSGVAIEEVSRWAKRGILSVPLDLAGAIASQVLRHYRAHAEQIEDMMYHLEEDILDGPLSNHRIQIMTMHHKAVIMKRAINYHQAIFTRLEEQNSERLKWMDGLQSEADCTLKTIEHAHEMVENLREAYQTAVQNYTNDIMKILTILATILLPINLITSFFGMNFATLPLVKSRYGMVCFYLISAIILLTIFVYFWKKKLFHVRHG